MSNVREFEYKRRHVKVTAGRTAFSQYVGFLKISSIDLLKSDMGVARDTIEGALDEGERKAKVIIDAKGEWHELAGHNMKSPESCPPSEPVY
jgi:hypothetical protein